MLLQNSSVEFISWNVGGLGSAVERSRVFSHLRCLKPDVCCLFLVFLLRDPGVVLQRLGLQSPPPPLFCFMGILLYLIFVVKKCKKKLLLFCFLVLAVSLHVGDVYLPLQSSIFSLQNNRCGIFLNKEYTYSCVTQDFS